jgi:site-specific DNA-methyltransferase (adenine-specific)/modification methylase
MITRIQGDMLLVSDQVQDNSVDLLLTDPPYNISENGANPGWTDPVTGENKNGIHNQRFDDSFEENWDSVSHLEFVKQLNDWSVVWAKKLRKGATFAVFISDRYISYLWTALESAGLEPKRVITWKKPAAVPFNRKVNPVSGCEYILWGIKPGGKRTFNSTIEQGTIVERMSLADKVSSIVYRAIREGDSTDISKILDSVKQEAQRVTDSRKVVDGKTELVIPNTITYSGGLGKDKIHPTQKPEEVLKYLISLCSKPGDTVLDTFAGSGSTGIAAQRLDRNAILIERDPKMFTKMNERFQFFDLLTGEDNDKT